VLGRAGLTHLTGTGSCEQTARQRLLPKAKKNYLPYFS
jgi:hypothetical protein